MIRRTPLFLLAMLALLVPAQALAASGERVDYLDTSETGVADPSGGSHFYALASDRDTMLVRLRPTTDRLGRSLDSRSLNGYWRFTGVAADGAAAGVSADGSTLVLAGYGDGGPKFTLIETDRLQRTETIALKGDYSLDSLSPDASTLYLVHYLDARDPFLYEVVAYDVEDGRLLPDPIIDRRLAPRVMAGIPLRREMSPDNVWAYTLYDGGREHHATPFVHALDTENARALCIDLPMLQHLPAPLLSKVTLEASDDGSSLAVNAGDGETLATIETGSWEVTEGEPADETKASEAGISPLMLIAAAIGGLVAVLLTARATRRSAR